MSSQTVWKSHNILAITLSNIILVLFISANNGEAQIESANSELKLQLVQVLFRHGDRNPVECYPNDPYKNESFWPEGFAQLTKRGKQQQYKLGKFLRKRYDGFLSQEYSPYEIYVQASDVDRTLMSAEANLAGLYPPQGAISLWNPSIQWQPVPVHTKPADIDNTLKMSAPCPRLNQAMQEFNESPFMIQLNKENQDLYEYLTNHSGKHVHDPEHVDFLYDTLHIETLYNYTLPDWTKKVFPGGQMYNLTALSFKIMTYTLELQRLRVGPLLNEIVTNMKERVEKKLDPRKKIFVYSAHDTTVASLLNTLEVYDDLPPPYASAVIIELYKNISSGSSFVQVHFRNESEREPYLLTLPGCNSSCLFEKFEEITKPKIPDNWEEECKSGFLGLVGIPLGALIVGTFLSIVLIVSMLVTACFKRKKSQKPAYPYLHLQMEDEDA